MDKNRIVVVLLAVLTLIAVGVVLKVARVVILPLVIAWLLSYILSPLIRVMERLRIPATLGVLLVLFLLLGVCFLSGYFIYSSVSGFAEAFPKYQARLSEIAGTLTSSLNLPPDLFNNLDMGNKIGAFVIRLSGTFVSFVSNLVTVLIFLVFMLLAKPYFKYKIRKAFLPAQADRVSHIVNSISGQIGRYLIVQFLISLVTGLLVWLALTLIGVDFAITWGALAFFLNFIPNVGSIIASIPPILIALVQFYPDLWPAVLTLLCVLAIQMVIGNFISPKVMGERLNLSPVVILVSLLFWGWLWGVVGALLSVPIAAAIMILCENVEALHPIAVLMGSGKKYQKEFQ